MQAMSIRVSVVVLGLASSSAAQEAISLAPRLEVGRRDRYRFEAEFRETLGDAPQAAVGGVEGLTPQRTMVQRGVVRLSVVRVVPGEGATVRLVFEELFVQSRSGDEPPVVFEWREEAPPAPDDNKAEDAPDADAGASPVPEQEKPHPLAAPGEALRRATLEFAVARNGEVSSVLGLDDAWRVAAGDKSSGTRLLGLFAPGAVETRLEALLRVDAGWPARDRAVGDSWEVIDSAALADRVRAVTATSLTLARISEGVAEIEGVSSVELALPPRDYDPADFKPTISEQQGEVRVRWDAARGRLLDRHEKRMLRVSVTLDDGLLTSAVTVSSRVNLTFLGEATDQPR